MNVFVAYSCSNINICGNFLFRYDNSHAISIPKVFASIIVHESFSDAENCGNQNRKAFLNLKEIPMLCMGRVYCF